MVISYPNYHSINNPIHVGGWGGNERLIVYWRMYIFQEDTQFTGENALFLNYLTFNFLWRSPFNLESRLLLFFTLVTTLSNCGSMAASFSDAAIKFSNSLALFSSPTAIFWRMSSSTSDMPSSCDSYSGADSCSTCSVAS